MAAPMLLSFLTVLFGCTKPPVYDVISTIIVHNQTAQGTAKTKLSGDEFQKAMQCLNRTREVRFEESTDEPLQAVILLQIKDRNGDRMFELLTDTTFKGNKGKYYRNDCILSIIRPR